VQVTFDAPSGTGQGVHEVVPHELVAVSDEHNPLQLCVPVGQPPQTAVASMHAPLHSFFVPEHFPEQTPAVHVGVPSVIAGQGEHEVPQLSVSLSLRHFLTLLQ
jgi:hypothetical protein